MYSHFCQRIKTRWKYSEVICGTVRHGHLICSWETPMLRVSHENTKCQHSWGREEQTHDTFDVNKWRFVNCVEQLSQLKTFFFYSIKLKELRLWQKSNDISFKRLRLNLNENCLSKWKLIISTFKIPTKL